MYSNQNLEIVHDKEIEIALFLKQICEENNLKYTMLGGTFLGAIRHKGFIPWDDDMDFGIPRNDYNKFLDLMENSKHQYNFMNFRNSDIKTYFSRLEDDSLNLIDKSAKVVDVRHPWIDIFPIDNVPEASGLKFKLYKYRLLYCRMMVQYSQFDEIVNLDLPNRPFPESLLIKVGKVIKPEKFLNTRKRMEILDRALIKYKDSDAHYAINFNGAYKFREMFKKDVYTELKLYPFEGAEFLGPADYDQYLSGLYGDYMTPPKAQDKNKHGIFIEDNK